jgi:hypothetical protein
MKIKIVSCNNPNYWYSSKIGEVFDVEKFNDIDYILNYELSFILKIDCIVLNNESEKEFKMKAEIIDQHVQDPITKAVDKISDLFGDDIPHSSEVAKILKELVNENSKPIPEKLVQITMTINEANNLRDYFGGHTFISDPIYGCAYKIDKDVINDLVLKLNSIVPGNRIYK